LAAARKGTREASEGTKDHSLLVYSALLQNEVLGAGIEDFKEAVAGEERRALSPMPPAAAARNLFSYRAQRGNAVNEQAAPYSLTPISAKSQRLLRSPRKASRKISKIPFKVRPAL